MQYSGFGHFIRHYERSVLQRWYKGLCFLHQKFQLLSAKFPKMSKNKLVIFVQSNVLVVSVIRSSCEAKHTSFVCLCEFSSLTFARKPPNCSYDSRLLIKHKPSGAYEIEVQRLLTIYKHETQSISQSTHKSGSRRLKIAKIMEHEVLSHFCISWRSNWRVIY